MTVPELIKSKDLEKSLLIGYYGGGNYGDELLLEVLQNILSKQGVKEVRIAYQKPTDFTQMHKDFGYMPINIHSLKELLSATFKSKNILIGGGGLWGVDINPTTFALGPYLFFCRHVLRKKVYLLGVGFYNSTNRLGRISAWFASKGANWIIGRDTETVTNFGKYTKHVSRDNDMAWQAMSIDDDTYASEVNELEKRIGNPEAATIFTLRRFKSPNGYASAVEEYLLSKRQPMRGMPIVMALENQPRRTGEYALLDKIELDRPDIPIIADAVNPLAIYFLFKKNQKGFVLVGPQFHIILTAYLNEVPFLPVVYDNKVTELMDEIGTPKSEQIPVQELNVGDIKHFLGREVYK